MVNPGLGAGHAETQYILINNSVCVLEKKHVNNQVSNTSTEINTGHQRAQKQNTRIHTAYDSLSYVSVEEVKANQSENSKEKGISARGSETTKM